MMAKVFGDSIYKVLTLTNTRMQHLLERCGTVNPGQIRQMLVAFFSFP